MKPFYPNELPSIKEIRIESNMTQLQLSKKSDIPIEKIQDIENGKIIPSGPNLYDICHALPDNAEFDGTRDAYKAFGFNLIDYVYADSNKVRQLHRANIAVREAIRFKQELETEMGIAAGVDVDQTVSEALKKEVMENFQSMLD